MFCTECGTQLKENQKFCTNCGSSIEVKTPNAASQSRPPMGSSAAVGREPASKSSPAFVLEAPPAHPPSSVASDEFLPRPVVVPSVTCSTMPAGTAEVGKVAAPRRGVSPLLLWGGVGALAVIAVAAVLLFLHSRTRSPAVSDAEIEKSLQAKFAGDPDLSKCTVEVRSQSGLVTLTGLVNKTSDRSTASRIVLQQPGVKTVVDNLVLPTTSQGTPKVATDDIHGVDFRNFQYRSDFLKETVRVSDGKWREVTPDGSPGSWFEVVKILYGDLKGDGQDEAVVLTTSGSNFNFQIGQIFVFFMSPQGPTLLQSLSLSDSGKGEEIDWSRISDVRITGRQLEISWLGGQCRACTDWAATATFHWNGSRLVRTGLVRTATGQSSSGTPLTQQARLGFANGNVAQDRDAELRRNCGDFKRVYVPDNVGNKFTDLCGYVGKVCEKVCDWEGRTLSCDAISLGGNRDGTRVAVCR
jgi:BON domain/zinc-ribbon domain